MLQLSVDPVEVLFCFLFLSVEHSLEFILQHIDDSTAAEIAAGPIKVRSLAYDWGLNDVRDGKQ
ncbi:MAG: hypothetical protein AAGH89_02955 [Verrucomicrobiota bacterium]